MILKKVKNEVGATAIEYGILSALIAVTTITALQLTGVKLDNTYCYIATQISKAVGGSGGRCSATPSNSSGSPAGSTSGSASGTGGTGGTGPSPSDSNPVSDSNSPSEKIDFNNAPRVLDGYELENLFEQTIGFKISGIYDSDKKPVQNEDELANALGITSDEINVLKKGIAAHNENIAPLITPRNNIGAQIEKGGSKWLYFAPLQNVKFTNPKGDVYRFVKQAPSYGNYTWQEDGSYNSIKIGDFVGPNPNAIYYRPF